jgi:hypothetical protein
MFRAAAVLEALLDRGGADGDAQTRVPPLGNPISPGDDWAADGSRGSSGGLEVHAELATATKLFSAAPTSFGDEPNTNIDPVTLGLPGALPVLNEQAVELAIRVGPGAQLHDPASVFARKNYFYPDMPKNYQISQYDQPINVDGDLELPNGQRVGIERAHLEEDTGKSTHVGGGGRIHGAEHSLVDYNRAGRAAARDRQPPRHPLADEARPTCPSCASILVAVGASDGKMEEGSMRVDANVSVRPRAPPLGTRCEIKNVNSLRSLGRAIDYEAARQIDLIESGERVRAGDPPLGRGRRSHPHAAHQGGGRRLPVLPRARPGAAPSNGLARSNRSSVTVVPQPWTPAGTASVIGELALKVYMKKYQRGEPLIMSPVGLATSVGSSSPHVAAGPALYPYDTSGVPEQDAR